MQRPRGGNTWSAGFIKAKDAYIDLSLLCKYFAFNGSLLLNGFLVFSWKAFQNVLFIQKSSHQVFNISICWQWPMYGLEVGMNWYWRRQGLHSECVNSLQMATCWGDKWERTPWAQGNWRADVEWKAKFGKDPWVKGLPYGPCLFWLNLIQLAFPRNQTVGSSDIGGTIAKSVGAGEGFPWGSILALLLVHRFGVTLFNHFVL